MTDHWHAGALDARDNVAMLLESVAAGADVRVKIGGAIVTITTREPIALGHKMALADVAPGDALTKYGECIGEATAPIARGAWVHVHNLRSCRGRSADASAGFDAYVYMDAVARTLDLPIPQASRETVAANLTRLHALAREVLEFPIPADEGATNAK
ncbi:MAG TPA: AtzG-like protein [Casimicrobiaceae bacterium]|nr:AtzG-like protein [Casimicrobiaceae bacterium]